MTPALLHDLLDQRAARSPRAPALSRGGRGWTYADLRGASLAAAGWLHGQRVGRGDRVLILDHNDMETVAMAFAASRLGAIYVIVSHRAPPYQLGHILADCRPRIVVGRGEAGARAAALTAVPVLDAADIPAGNEAEAAGDRWRARTGALLASDPVSLIYTSGSTALPKAVVSTHQQVLFAVGAIQARLRYRPADVVLCCLPLSFDYGLYQAFLCASAGAALALGDERDAGTALLRRLTDSGASVLPLMPSLAASLCLLLERPGRRPPGLRMVTSTGASLAPALAARLRALIPGATVIAMFGLTECKRVSIAEPDLDLTRPGSVGRALPGTEVLVAGPDGRWLPPGEVGELVVRGPHVMAGYWNSPQETAARFRRDYLGRTALHTGDYGRMDECGYLYFVGRRDDVYKQNGFRISTTEVEAAALDIPGVQVAVALAPDDDHSARLAVSGSITPERLAKELRTRLEAPKAPADCLVLDAVPLTSNGKIDRRAVREQWRTARGRPLVAPA